MKSQIQEFPNQYFVQEVTTTPQVQSLPFYIKEYGYCNEKKFTLGHNNDYDEYLILYSVSGTVRFTKSNNGTQHIPPDNIVISSCNTPLTFVRTTKNWKFIYIIVSGSHAKFFYNHVRNASCIVPCTPYQKTLDSLLEIVSMKFSGNLYDNMYTSFLVYGIFLDLYNVTHNILNAKQMTPIQETVVNQAIRYIQKHYKNNLDIDTVCGEIRFSKFYFCKLFKKHTGKTLHQYIIEYRVNKSKDLLTYSKLSISDVGRSVGFENPLTYSRCFERQMHMTPSEYRQNF